jgi:exopolysaccharide production protein ExoQ
MMQIASLVFLIGIIGLFVVGRDSEFPVSKAMWIPVAWLLIVGSRPVSVWMAMFGLAGTPSAATADQLLDGSPTDRNVFILLLALGLIVLFMRYKVVAGFLRANLPILVFFSYCALSVLWSDFPDVASKRFIKSLGDLVMVLIVVTDPFPSAAIKRIFARVGFILVPLSVLFVKYFPFWGRVYSPWDGEQTYTGVSINKNMLGTICLVIGIGCAWCFLEAFRGEGINRKGRMIAHATVFGMALWLILLADSATSLSCLVLTTGLMVVLGWPVFARRRVVAHILVFGILFVCIFATFFNTGGGLLETVGRNSSLTGRTEIWGEVITIANSGNSVLGTGFESFWLGPRLQRMWSMHWWHPNEAHNGYLEVYLNLGWVGIFLLGVLFVTGYRTIIAAVRQDAYAGRLRLAFFTATFVYSLTEAGFRMLSPPWIFFLKDPDVGLPVKPLKAYADTPLTQVGVYQKVPIKLS